MDPMTAQPPPHLRAEVAERGVIGSLLRDADAVLDDVLRVISGPEDFYSHPHALLFATCQSLRAASSPIQADTVFMALVKNGIASELGSHPGMYLADLLTDHPTGANATYYAEQVRDASLRRRARREALRIFAATEETPTCSADEFVGSCERAFRELSDAGSCAAEPAVLPDLVKLALADLDDRVSGGGEFGLPTGLVDLDALLGGFRRGQLVVIGARPGAGKSALALSFLIHICREVGVPGYLASLEMSSLEMCHRILAMGTGVNLHSITRAKLSSRDADQLARAPQMFGNTMLTIDDTPTVTAQRVYAQVRRQVRRRGVQFAAVDYLQLMGEANPGASRVQQVDQLSRDMKLMARECNIPVLLLSQLNRQPEARSDGRPKLSDLRESGGIEQNADAVILLHVPAKQDESAECWQVTAIVAKNRNGPTGEVSLIFRRPVVRFENYSHGSDYR